MADDAALVVRRVAVVLAGTVFLAVDVRFLELPVALGSTVVLENRDRPGLFFLVLVAILVNLRPTFPSNLLSDNDKEKAALLIKGGYSHTQ